MKEHRCDICGRPLRSLNKTHGYILCAKHCRQLRLFGEFLDNNPRTVYDENEYHIDGDVTYIDLYNRNGDIVAQTIIDTEDLDRVKHIKWRLNNQNYVVTSPRNGTSTRLHRVILGIDDFVDHINHNTLDNRKANLRPCTKSQNQMNSNYKGAYQRKNGTWYGQITVKGKKILLGVYPTQEEALYARWYAETILFGEFQYEGKVEPELPEQRKEQIREYVDRKVQRL